MPANASRWTRCSTRAIFPVDGSSSRPSKSGSIAPAWINASTCDEVSPSRVYRSMTCCASHTMCCSSVCPSNHRHRRNRTGNGTRGIVTVGVEHHAINRDPSWHANFATRTDFPDPNGATISSGWTVPEAHPPAVSTSSVAAIARYPRISALRGITPEPGTLPVGRKLRAILCRASRPMPVSDTRLRSSESQATRRSAYLNRDFRHSRVWNVAAFASPIGGD